MTGAVEEGIAGALARLRVGTGIDVHAWADGRPLILGGVRIPHDGGLDGHSDADMLAHAVMNAVLGGAGLDDIGSYFPSDDPTLEGADSMQLLARVVDMVAARGCTIVNVDCVAVMQAPRLAPHREAIRMSLASVLRIDAGRVTVRASTTDHLGFIGRREGAATVATCLVLHPS